MQNESINIYTSDKIIFDTLINKNNYFENFKFIYFALNDFVDGNVTNNNLNIIFIPSNFMKDDCKIIIQTLKKNKLNNTIVCVEKKLSSLFYFCKNNLLFIPVFFIDLDKMINLIKLSTSLTYKKLKFDRRNNTLTNIDNNSVIPLTLIEGNILDILIVENNPVTKRLINSKALGQSEGVNSHSIDSHIYRLRKKLLTISSKTKIVANKKGYYQII